MDELRLALRRLRIHPAATAASILTLACAIGAAAATWSLLSAVLLRPLPVRDPDRLLVLGLRAVEGRDAGVLQTGLTYAYYPYLRDGGAAGAVAAYWTDVMGLDVSLGDGNERRRVQSVSHDFFDVLGVGIQHGRSFAARDDALRHAPSHARAGDKKDILLVSSCSSYLRDLRGAVGAWTAARGLDEGRAGRARSGKALRESEGR